jgi:hypothetical protein
MPCRVGLRPTFAQVCRDHGPEMIHPAPNGLIGDHEAFCQQIVDVAEAQREPEIEPDRLLDDFGRKAIAAIADFLAWLWLISIGYAICNADGASAMAALRFCKPCDFASAATMREAALPSP